MPTIFCVFFQEKKEKKMWTRSNLDYKVLVLISERKMFFFEFQFLGLFSPRCVKVILQGSVYTSDFRFWFFFVLQTVCILLFVLWCCWIQTYMVRWGAECSIPNVLIIIFAYYYNNTKSCVKLSRFFLSFFFPKFFFIVRRRERMYLCYIT